MPQKEPRGIFTYYLTRTLREVSPHLGLIHIAAVVTSTVAAFTTGDGKNAQNPVLLGNVGLDEEIGTFFEKISTIPPARYTIPYPDRRQLSSETTSETIAWQ